MAVSGFDPLDAEMDDEEAVNSIKELYNVDEDTAKEMWRKFIETAKKLRDIKKRQEEGGAPPSQK